jgi:HPt (histidine-containing phosphotransfer) domain-containing protein
MLSDRDACLDAGMNEHIGKPFDIGVLVSLLIRMTGLQPAPTPMGEPLGATVAVKNGTEIAGLDLQTALNRMSGMQTLYVRTARDFVRTLDTVVTELEHYLAVGDRQKALMRLHTVKGNAGTLGATALAEKAAQLEKLCATDAGMHECAQGLGPLETLVRSTQKTLNEAIVALESPSPSNPPAAANTSSQVVSAAATNALRRIAELAQASDLEALQEFAQSRDSLSALPEDAMDALDGALQELDLARVATLCNAMLASLGQQE